LFVIKGRGGKASYRARFIFVKLRLEPNVPKNAYLPWLAKMTDLQVYDLKD